MVQPQASRCENTHEIIIFGISTKFAVSRHQSTWCKRVIMRIISQVGPYLIEILHILHRLRFAIFNCTCKISASSDVWLIFYFNSCKGHLANLFQKLSFTYSFACKRAKKLKPHYEPCLHKQVDLEQQGHFQQ